LVDELTKSTLGLTTGLMGTSIALNATKLIPKNFGIGGKKSSKNFTKNFLKVGTETMVGVGILGGVSSQISKL
jgi:hypothetical protein